MSKPLPLSSPRSPRGEQRPDLAPPFERPDTDFSSAHVVVSGRPMVADRTGALFWPGQSALLVADLHLEKGSALAERGSYLPPYDTRTTLGRLAAAIDRFDPDRVICLGDSLHDRRAHDRLMAEDLDLLRDLQEGRDWLWIAGNHDPVVPERLGGRFLGELGLGGLLLTHEPTPGRRMGEIAGHLHPAARIVRYGVSLRRPCFVSDGKRLVMPAFGTFTGGLNVLDEAFAPLFGNDGLAVWMLGHEGIYPVATRQLRGD
ncbi:MAG: ligase-associated DNA damage response endonuclease PdeM [Hyphomicrobiaceae bacterium]